MKALDDFLGKPGGAFLLNLLAQQGYSYTPSSPLAAVGKAGLAANEQKRQGGLDDLQKRVFESQIGLNTAQAQKALNPAAGNPATPQTQMAKLRADLEGGFIDADIYKAEREKILSESVQMGFDNTKALRTEYNSVTANTRQSLGSLSSAATLIQTAENPIAHLTAFISMIKSIDNSTVREGELAAFNAVQGFAIQLEKMLTTAKGEGFPAPMRRSIAEVISKMQAPLREHLNAQRGFYSEEARKHRLDPISVTGASFMDSGQIDLNNPMFKTGGETGPRIPLLPPNTQPVKDMS